MFWATLKESSVFSVLCFDIGNLYYISYFLCSVLLGVCCVLCVLFLVCLCSVFCVLSSSSSSITSLVLRSCPSGISFKHSKKNKRKLTVRLLGQRTHCSSLFCVFTGEICEQLTIHRGVGENLWIRGKVSIKVETGKGWLKMLDQFCFVLLGVPTFYRIFG